MQRVEGTANPLMPLKFAANVFVLFRRPAALYNVIYAEFQPLWG